jgi:F-type H+-transporting ATPase subunit delta
LASNKQIKVASRYSKALLRAMFPKSDDVKSKGTVTPEIAKSLESMAAVLFEFAKAVSENKQIVQFFQNPTVPQSSKEKVLTGVLKSLNADVVLTSFLNAMLKNNRISCMTEVARRFSEEVRSALSILAVKVTTARELPQSQKEEISKMMSKKSELKLEFDWFVNQSLLGGIVLEYAGKKYDSSISGALENLKEQLKF